MNNSSSFFVSYPPYVDVQGLEGRFITTSIFYVEDGWKAWTQSGEFFLPIRVNDQEEFFYFSEKPARHGDLYFEFLNFLAEMANFLSTRNAILGLHDDVFNLSASLSKVLMIHKARNDIGRGVGRMIVGEVEFIYSTCRSMFDLLQEIIFKVLGYMKPSSVGGVKIKKKYSEMVMIEGRVALAADIKTRFGLPDDLANFYGRHAPFFMSLREFRDNVVHNGSRVPEIYSSDNGIFVFKGLRPFCCMDIWRPEEVISDRLVCIKPALGYIVHRTLLACDEAAAVLKECFDFPAPIVPKMRLYMRSHFGLHFQAVLHDAQARKK